jgi:8-oxo-dGTP diphosphatase
MHVVAAAIVDGGRVLAARRRRDGRWEFPGGKVEDGETARAALRRECREELAIDVVVGRNLAEADQAGLTLTVYEAALNGGRPVAGPDHDELRWLDAADLPDLDWLDLDRQLLFAVAARLSADRKTREA